MQEAVNSEGNDGLYSLHPSETVAHVGQKTGSFFTLLFKTNIKLANKY